MIESADPLLRKVAPGSGRQMRKPPLARLPQLKRWALQLTLIVIVPGGLLVALAWWIAWRRSRGPLR